MGLAFADEIGIHDHQAFHAVSRSIVGQRLERRVLMEFGDDQFAETRMRNVVSCAVLIKKVAALNAQSCFERARWIVNAGVDDAGVVRARFQPEARMALENADDPIGTRERTSRGESDYTATDDCDIDGFHWRYIIRNE